MKTLVVVDRPENWPLEIPGVEVVAALEYLTAERFAGPGLRVLNLCRSYRYQTLGYYVSLLALSRGHRPLPSATTIQDLRTWSIVRALSEELDELIQHSLAPLQSDDFELSIYFSENMAKRYRRLARRFYELFPAPLLRARFRRRHDEWELTGLRLIGTKDVQEAHRPFVIEAAGRHLRRRERAANRPVGRYDLAILVEEGEAEPPSDEKAIKKLVKAGEAVGLEVDLVSPDDYGRIGEYDALFLRMTTGVEHVTYRFARRAKAEGLVVIDEPDAILRCMNKVFLHELLSRHKLPTPRTRVVHRDNLERVGSELGFPCILKRPDSAFSQGVKRADDVEAFRELAAEYLETSELLIAQEFLPTEFDWRIGVLGGRPLYACRYHMARGHWQIVQHEGTSTRYGKVDTLALEDVPAEVVVLAVLGANLIGDGLFGVDLKEGPSGPMIIEVNDNPNLEAGYEDAVLGDALYESIMRWFLDKLDLLRGQAKNGPA
ncbi:MAG TPA: RimK family protein [Thermoanaerobaculia bacterium]|nr:RimK family protein [Thermoanaerobaculia bacterium]